MKIANINIPSKLEYLKNFSSEGGKIGKVVSKEGNQIEVIVGDKVIKIESSGNSRIKVGDMIQVFFGEENAEDVSSKLPESIKAKLLEVFDLSLPFEPGKKAEEIISSLPQKEKIFFSKISNELIEISKKILSEKLAEDSLSVSQKAKNPIPLLDNSLPYNRRLVELSFRILALGKGWEVLPKEAKEQIVKEFVFNDSKPSGTEPDGKASKNLLKIEEPALALNSLQTVKRNPEESSMKGTDISKEEDKVFSSIFRKMGVTVKESPLLDGKRIEFEENRGTAAKGEGSSDFIYRIRRGFTSSENKAENEVKNNQELKMDLRKESESVSTTGEKIVQQGNKEELSEKNEVFVKKIAEFLKRELSEPASIKKTLRNYGKEMAFTIPPRTMKEEVSGEINSIGKSIQKILAKDDSVKKEDSDFLKIIQRISEKKENTGQVFSFSNLEEIPLEFDEYEEADFILKKSILKLESEGFEKMIKKSFPEISDKSAGKIASELVRISLGSFKEPEIISVLFTKVFAKYAEKFETDFFKFRKEVIGQKESISFQIIDKETAQNSPVEFKKISVESENSDQLAEKKYLSFVGELKKFAEKIFMVVQNHILKQKAEKINPDSSDSTEKKQESLISEKVAEKKETQILIKFPEKKEEPSLSKENEIIKSSEKTDTEKKELSVNEKKEEASEKPEVNRDLLKSANLRLLNISGNMNNENLYSGIFNWDGSNFRVDILEKKGKETGYAQKKMYRIQIEADTQLAGDVFIDAFFLDKGTELNLYVDERFQKVFTENSPLLYRRLRNDGFLIKAINIRNALSNENIIEKKIEIILPKEGRFSKLA